MSTSLYLMAWNELLARIFDGFRLERDVSPEWLVNPGTRRRLKLDLYYPEIGLAVRFIGLQVKGAGRKSEWEEREEAARDEVRKALCQQHGIELILLDPVAPLPSESLKTILMTLAAISRRLAQGKRVAGKAALMERLAAARNRTEALRHRIQRLEDLPPYAESWRDREMTAVAPLPRPSAAATAAVMAAQPLQVGQEVDHIRYGRGTLSAVEAKADDVYLTIRFRTGEERRFAASLVADKLHVPAD